jgi:hypothetical protein
VAAIQMLPLGAELLESDTHGRVRLVRMPFGSVAQGGPSTFVESKGDGLTGRELES